VGGDSHGATLDEVTYLCRMTTPSDVGQLPILSAPRQGVVTTPAVVLR
jgi:hypothetical protein